jgi:hypothetical protein
MPEGGQLDVNHIGQFVLGVIGNANGGGIALETHPLVGFRVFEVSRDICAHSRERLREWHRFEMFFQLFR